MSYNYQNTRFLLIRKSLNLNFIPTSKRYNVNQLCSDIQNFFRLMKLRALFKDKDCITTINQPNQQLSFKIKNKEKCPPPPSAPPKKAKQNTIQ